ncbi:MAG: hypothetical protein HYX68_06885 [Planctomycetes bacterium]|jgi:hypothetical protein|nr:hypothetical protein [Planctomycetota bacterium]
MNSQVDVRPLWDVLSADLGGVLDQASAGRPDWARLELVLDCLPLATAEHARCCNQLRNARAYFNAGETGAGGFELSQLIRRLRQVTA